MCIIYTLKYIEHSAAHKHTRLHTVYGTLNVDQQQQQQQPHHSECCNNNIRSRLCSSRYQYLISGYYFRSDFPLLCHLFSIKSAQTNIHAHAHSYPQVFCSCCAMVLFSSSIPSLSSCSKLYVCLCASLSNHFQFYAKGWTLIFTFMLMNLDEMWIELTLSSITMFALITTTNEIDCDKLDALI